MDDPTSAAPDPPRTDQVTDRERQLESGGFWEAPTDVPGETTATPAVDEVTDRDRMLESGGFWEAPVDPSEEVPSPRAATPPPG